MRIGAKINKLLRDMNLSDREAAKRIGDVSATTVGRWRKGEGEPSVSEAVRVARLFSVPLDYLAFDEIETAPKRDANSEVRASILRLVDLIGEEESLRRLALANPAGDGAPKSPAPQQPAASYGRPVDVPRPPGAKPVPPERRSPRHGGFMYLVQAGHLTISVEHVILAEDSDKEPPPKSLPDGVLRLTLERGRVVDLKGEAADRVRGHLGILAKGDAEPQERSASVGRPVPVPPRPPRRQEVPDAEKGCVGVADERGHADEAHSARS